MADIRGGLRFIRGRVWIWGTLVSAAVAYLLFLGPTEVLLPYLVKNDLHESARTLGLVFAAGGVGAIGSAVLMGQREQPRRHITFIYVVWTLATLAVAGYGLATAAWQVMRRVPARSTPSRPPAPSSGRRSSSAMCRPTCWAGSRASTG